MTEPKVVKVAVSKLNVVCRYPVNGDPKNICGLPATSAVQDKDGNNWYRCHAHEGLLFGTTGGKVRFMIERKKGT